MLKNIENQMNSVGYNPSIWNSDFNPSEYQIPSSPNPNKFSNMPPNFQVHTPVLIIHKSDDPRKKALKESDEILPEFTLPGQLISIIRGNGGKADLKLILEKIEPLFPHLRRINGRKYSGKIMKTVIGGLHSTEIFQFDTFGNVWEVKEDLAKKYEKKTVEKFKVWQKKITKKKQNNESPIKRKLKKFEPKNHEPKRIHETTNLKNHEAPSVDSFHNLKDYEGGIMHPNENSFNHAEFGNYLMNEGNENDFKREEEIIFENSNNLKNSPNNGFPIMNQFNEEHDLSNIKSDDKTRNTIKRKKRTYKRSYEKYNVAFKSLEKVVEYMMEKNYANLIKNPFSNLNGTESSEEIIQKIGTENIIGVVRCFDYFKPLIMENLEKKNKLRNLAAKGEGKKTNFLVNVAKDVSDIKNKLNNIFNHKN